MKRGRRLKWGDQWKSLGLLWGNIRLRSEDLRINLSRAWMADSRVVRWIMDNNFGNERGNACGDLLPDMV